MKRGRTSLSLLMTTSNSREITREFRPRPTRSHCLGTWNRRLLIYGSWCVVEMSRRAISRFYSRRYCSSHSVTEEKERNEIFTFVGRRRRSFFGERDVREWPSSHRYGRFASKSHGNWSAERPGHTTERTRLILSSRNRRWCPDILDSANNDINKRRF